MTPNIGLTKPATSSRLDAGVLNGHIRTLNTDLDILDTAIGALSGAGMSNPMTAAGDIIVGGAGGLPSRLGVGTNGQVLTVGAGGVLTWAAPAASGGPPSGPAGGALAGTYPNPQIATSAVTDVHVAAPNKDGIASLPSMRTLGTGAQQAAAGDDARFTDARVPTAHRTTHEPGGSDAMAVNAAAGTGSLRTLGTTPTSAAAGDHAHAGMLTNPMTTTQDIIVGGTAGAPTRLGVGSSTQVLTVVGGTLAWAAPASGGMTNPMTTLGDLIAGAAAGAATRLGVGTNGTVLTADSTAAAGVAWAAPALVRNVVTNPGMEIWQRGAGAFTVNSAFTADRWQIDISGGSTLSVTRESTTVDTDSQYAAACAYTHVGAGALWQHIEDWRQLRGRTVTFTARVRAAATGTVRLRVRDSVDGYRDGATNTTTGAFETLTLTAPIAAATTLVQVTVAFLATGTYYVDDAVLVVGSSAPAYAPLHPADDLARCQRYYQEWGGLATNEQIAAGMCASTTLGDIPLRLPVEMALAPTVTISTAGDFLLIGNDGASKTVTALSFSQQTRRSVRCLATVASGLTAGGGTSLMTANTAARIRFESNP